MSVVLFVVVGIGVLVDCVIFIVGVGGGFGSVVVVVCVCFGVIVVLLGCKLCCLDCVYVVVQVVGFELLLYLMDLEGVILDDYVILVECLQGELGCLDGLLYCVVDFVGLILFELVDLVVFVWVVYVNFIVLVWLIQVCLLLLCQCDDVVVVFIVDDLMWVGQVYWGGYGVVQYGLWGLIVFLYDELGCSLVWVSGLQLGLMCIVLWVCVFLLDEDCIVCDLVDCVDVVVLLLFVVGVFYCGQIVEG